MGQRNLFLQKRPYPEGGGNKKMVEFLLRADFEGNEMLKRAICMTVINIGNL